MTFRGVTSQQEVDMGMEEWEGHPLRCGVGVELGNRNVI